MCTGFTGYKVFHIHHLISSSQQPCEVGRAGSNVSICTYVATEAQRGSMTCLKPPSKSAAELGPEVRSQSHLQPPALSADRAVFQEDPSPSRALATPEPGLPSTSWHLGRQPPTPTGQPRPLHLLPANCQPRAGPVPATPLLTWAALAGWVSGWGWTLLSCFPEWSLPTGEEQRKEGEEEGRRTRNRVGREPWSNQDIRSLHSD